MTNWKKLMKYIKSVKFSPIFKIVFKTMYFVPTKNGLKNPKKTSLSRAWAVVLGKDFFKKKLKTFAWGPTIGPQQRLMDLGRRYPMDQNCRGLGSWQRHLCRGLFFVEASEIGPRQMGSLLRA